MIIERNLIKEIIIGYMISCLVIKYTQECLLAILINPFLFSITYINRIFIMSG